MLKRLVIYLKMQKKHIVREKQVLVDNWDPTYGQGDPRVETLEYVDFDSLVKCIDEFAESFKE